MTAERPGSPIAPARHVLEAGQRLSGSLLWDLQRAFYRDHGVDAWRKGHIPYRLTSSPFIADQYAQVVAAHLEDRRDDLADPSRPLDIIELGAGSGQFAFHFLHRLTELVARMPAPIRWRLVMTDLAEKNLGFWRDHPQLAPFVARGVLDFARFDAVRDHSLTLVCGGETLRAPLPNGAVVLANYIFCTLPIDVFAVEGGRLRECLVTVASSRPEPDPRAPDVLARVDLGWDPAPATADGYYEDAAFDAVLRAYQALPDTTVLFPIEALRCCRRLRALSGGRMLLLSSDKGYVHDLDVRTQARPSMSLHGGSFSLCVDYHALGRYFRDAGGAQLRPRRRPEWLLTTALLLGDAAGDHPRTRQAYAATIDRFNADDAYVADERTTRGLADAPLDAILDLMQARLADPWLVLQCLPLLTERLAGSSEQQRRVATRILEEAWDRHYHLDEDDDLPFAAGVFFYQMDDLDRALAWYARSLERFGDSPHTRFNMALCYHVQGRPLAAQVQLRRTLELMPDHDRAAELLRELTQPA